MLGGGGVIMEREQLGGTFPNAPHSGIFMPLHRCSGTQPRCIMRRMGETKGNEAYPWLDSR